jgi:glycosyltransferase involved in cell wall biosynthesis
MIENPLVSIVVPVYNVEKYLPKCLDSLVSQTYTHTEIVVVNDGSTDGSRQILQAFAGKDRRIKIVDKPNGGLPSARNAGVAVAAGEYIWHVDSDDYTEPDSLEKMVAVALRDNSDIVVAGYKRILNPEKPEEYSYVGPRFDHTISGAEALRLMLCMVIGGDVWAKLYKRSLYTTYKIVQNEEFSAVEDAMLNYQTYAKAKIVSPLEHAVINHIYRAAGSYSSQSKTIAFRLKHHQGIMYMASYGFPTEDIKNAYYGYLGVDFLYCFRLRSKALLKAIDATGFWSIYRGLTYVSCYRLINGGGVKNLKIRLLAMFLHYKFIRIITACICKMILLCFR